MHALHAPAPRAARSCRPGISSGRPLRALRALLWTGAFAAFCSQAADFDLDLVELNEISPRPGTVIGAGDYARHALLFDRDFGKFIAGGFAEIRVGEPVSFNPHPAFVAATALFRGQPALSDNPGVLLNFAQGRPFTGTLNVQDPQSGAKAAWNMRYAYTGDSGILPELHWQLRDWRTERIDMEMLFEARSMRFMYRHVQEPVPFIEKNPQDAYGSFLLEARDAGSYDGTQALVFANRDESREVNGWVYIPQLGRTQSLASFSTEESMFGSDILPTDFLVYSGRLVDMHWRYLGATFMLVPMYRHDLIEVSERKARKYDYWHTDFEGRAGCFPKVQWQLRPILILEGTATNPAALVSRRVFYLDAQTYVPVLWKIYRDSDQLWKFVIGGYAHPNSHVAQNNETGAPILTAFSTIDTQTNRCTTVQLLTLIKVPDVVPDDFDTGTMESGGRGSFRRR